MNDAESEQPAPLPKLDRGVQFDQKDRAANVKSAATQTDNLPLPSPESFRGWLLSFRTLRATSYGTPFG
jgi:hypothetical protein